MEPDHSCISISRQCELLGLARSTWYYKMASESEENLLIMNLLDEQYTRTPYYGVERMTAWLRHAKDLVVNQKRVRRLLRQMGLMAIHPSPRLSQPAPGHKIYPYLLRGVTVDGPDHVWSTDITYIRMKGGFMYLVAIIDWYSRYVLSWELSSTLDTEFCLSSLERALASGRRPRVFNTDQGSQFTSTDYTGRLLREKVQISMDGRGRALDNVFVERLWRSLKYEEVYLNDYACPLEARSRLAAYLAFYNCERLHQSLGYRTPHTVYYSSEPAGVAR